MPNKYSQAGHIAMRTCVICRCKAEQESLFSFFLLGHDLVIDLHRAIEVRKQYICRQPACLEKLDKWISRQLKKKGAAA